MITAKKLQRSYNKLYANLREYIWPYYIISSIADLEIETYQTFPDSQKLRGIFNNLRVECTRLVGDDEDLNGSFEEYNELLNDSNHIYAKLNSRLESDVK